MTIHLKYFLTVLLFLSFAEKSFTQSLGSTGESAVLESLLFYLILVLIIVSSAAVIIFIRLYKKKKTYNALNVLINALTHPFIVHDIFSGVNEILNSSAREQDSPYLKFLKENSGSEIPFTKKTVLETRKPASAEREFINNNSKKYFEFFGFPVFNSKGVITQIVEYSVDVTEKKETIDKIRTAFEREKELNELKSTFISSTSHEFRTPLATLFSSVELIEHYDKTKSEDKKLYHLARIKDIVVYMTKMLDNILMINKAEVDRLAFEPEEINIKSLSSEILEDIIIAASNNHLIDQVIEGKNENVFLDPNLTRHMLTNLLSNAIKYSPEGGKILFKTEIHDNEIIFIVRDEGIGIPHEDKKNLFQYFFRARNSRAIPGTGLGLSIVKKSVEVHKGTIEYTSTEDEGTTFVVKLPINAGVEGNRKYSKVIGENYL